MTPSITESQVLKALRSFLLSVLPSGIEVVRGQDNRVPEPKVSNFAVMTPLFMERLSTNVTSYSEADQARTDMAPMKVTVQLDVYGPSSADNAQAIALLFRSDIAASAFASSGADVTPLYAGEPRQAPFRDGEQQIEQRWTMDVVMQTNPAITSPQDFADAATTELVNIPASYPDQP